MPVAVAAAGAAAIQSSMAAQAAHRALVAQCKATMPKFNASKATVAEMKEYSKCVNTLYPTEVSSETIIAFKVLFVIALVGMVIGVWKARRDGVVDAALVGLLGFLVLPCAVAFAFGLLYGIYWLLMI